MTSNEDLNSPIASSTEIKAQRKAAVLRTTKAIALNVGVTALGAVASILISNALSDKTAINTSNDLLAQIAENTKPVG